MTFFEKLGELIALIKPKEMMFDVNYVKEIKTDNCKNVALYQTIVLFIKIVEKIAFVYSLGLVLNFFRT